MLNPSVMRMNLSVDPIKLTHWGLRFHVALQEFVIAAVKGLIISCQMSSLLVRRRYLIRPESEHSLFCHFRYISSKSKVLWCKSDPNDFWLSFEQIGKFQKAVKWLHLFTFQRNVLGSRLKTVLDLSSDFETGPQSSPFSLKMVPLQLQYMNQLKLVQLCLFLGFMQ